MKPGELNCTFCGKETTVGEDLYELCNLCIKTHDFLVKGAITPHYCSKKCYDEHFIKEHNSIDVR